MSTAIVDIKANTSRTLDRKAEPDEVVKESDVTDASKLARLLARILRQLAGLLRRPSRRQTTFINLTVLGDGATVYRLPHRFGGAVTWSVVGWRSAAGGAQFVESTASDRDTLSLVSHEAGVAAIRVEELG